MFRLRRTPFLRSLPIGLATIAFVAALVSTYGLGYYHGVHDAWYGRSDLWWVELTSFASQPSPLSRPPL